MEAVTRNVRDIETSDRRALEHVVGRQLKENQQVIIQVVTLSSEPKEGWPASVSGLPDWCNVYEGLSDTEIAEVEDVILPRADLSRLSA